MVRICVVGVIVVHALVAQSTLLVPGQFPSIQAAINAAQGTDSVVVASGLYPESIDFLGKAITVVGPPDRSAIIQGDGAGRVVSFVSGEGPGSVLRRVTVTNGDGGIGCVNSAPTIDDCTIENNVTAAPGGGIYFQYTTLAAPCSPVVQDCLITNNFSSDRGGGLAYTHSQAGSAGFVPGTPAMAGCHVLNNMPWMCCGMQAGSAGGACFEDCSPSVVDCTFEHDQGWGGALLEISAGFPGSSATVERCRFLGYNAGIVTHVDTAQMRGNLMAGGWFGANCSGLTSASSSSILQCTLVTGGPALFLGVNAVIDGCIIWCGTPDPVFVAPGVSVAISCTDVSGVVPAGPGNFSADPLFRTP